MALDTLLKDLNAYRRIPKNKRKALLMSLNSPGSQQWH